MRKTIVYSKKLEEAGLTRQQAEAHLEILGEVIEEDVATKADFIEFKTEMRNEIRNLEYKMTIKLGTIVCLAMGALATFFKFFI